MNPIKLTLGCKLELELYDNDGEHNVPLLVSQFESDSPDGTLNILAPIHEGRIYPIRRGTKMDIIYEKNGELFKFSAETVERKISGNIYLLAVKPLSEEERLQRRTFFRFSTILDVQYRMFRELEEEDRGTFKKTITRDISGGGLCLLTNEKPHYGWYIEGVLNIQRDIPFIGRIVRVINVHDKGKFNYEVGVEFVEIKNPDREKIIGFIFDSQRKLLKKGWLT